MILMLTRNGTSLLHLTGKEHVMVWQEVWKGKLIARVFNEIMISTLLMRFHCLNGRKIRLKKLILVSALKKITTLMKKNINHGMTNLSQLKIHASIIITKLWIIHHSSASFFPKMLKLLQIKFWKKNNAIRIVL